MSRILIADSGGVVRQPKRLFVADSGGVARAVKRMFVADSGGVARLVYISVFETTLTVGSQSQFYNVHDQSFTYYHTFTVHSHGYSAGPPSYGSLGTDQYSDFGGNTRTISAVTWDDQSQLLQFVLTASAPNTDNTFKYITVNGITFQRSLATYTGTTNWHWNPGFNPIGFTGSWPFRIGFV